LPTRQIFSLCTI